jgi:hydroxymethylpyrimidine/phosphomethylpyrimidine kinase
MTKPCVLVFAGSDPSGGAGLQADIQAITALGAHPLPIVTVLTVQDNNHVFAAHPVPAALVKQQAQALLDKIGIATVKIGIVGNRANAEAIADIINTLRRKQPDLPVVLDPVLASGHGHALGVEDAAQALAPLLPIATLVTPNLPEANVLCQGERRLDAQAESLLQQGCRHVLIKGGHATGPEVVNRWFTQGDFRSWTWPRLIDSYHGSGCTLAAATAALLINGRSMPDALALAQAYCHQALISSFEIGAGQRIPDRSIAFF